MRFRLSKDICAAVNDLFIATRARSTALIHAQGGAEKTGVHDRREVNAAAFMTFLRISIDSAMISLPAPARAPKRTLLWIWESLSGY